MRSNIWERVNKGEFYTKFNNPYIPCKKGIDLDPNTTPAEVYLDAAKRNEQNYKDELEKYNNAKQAVFEDKKRLEEVFKRELCAEYKVPYDNHFAQIMIELSWRYDDDLTDVIERFENLLPLWEIYNDLLHAVR